MHSQSILENKVKKYLTFLKVLRNFLLKKLSRLLLLLNPILPQHYAQHKRILLITIIQVIALNFSSTENDTKQINLHKIYTGSQKTNEEVMLSVLKSKHYFQIPTKHPICWHVSSI